MDIDEKHAINFLKNYEFKTRKFKKKERALSKTPDFKVLKNGKLIFFCEVKTIKSDDGLVQEALKTPLLTFGPGKGNDPRYNRISNKIYEAAQQFKAVNPNLEYPNVLIFINHDKKSGPNELIGVITGKILTTEGRVYPIYKKFSEGRIRKDKYNIHLYRWLDDFGKDYWLFNNDAKEHLNNLCNYFNINPDEIKIFRT